MKKYWAARIPVALLRSKFRALAEDGNVDARDALEHLRGRRGALNYLEASAGSVPSVKAIIQEVGTEILAQRGY